MCHFTAESNDISIAYGVYSCEINSNAYIDGSLNQVEVAAVHALGSISVTEK